VYTHKKCTHYYTKDVPKVIPWEKLDHIAYAFAVPDKNGDLSMFEEKQLQKGICFKSAPKTRKLNKLLF
jgi:chitinase